MSQFQTIKPHEFTILRAITDLVNYKPGFVCYVKNQWKTLLDWTGITKNSKISIYSQTVTGINGTKYWNKVVTDQYIKNVNHYELISAFKNHEEYKMFNEIETAFLQIEHYDQYISQADGFTYSCTGSVDYNNALEYCRKKNVRELPTSLYITVQKHAFIPVDYLNITKMGLIIKVLKGSLHLWLMSALRGVKLCQHLLQCIDLSCSTLLSHGCWLPNKHFCDQENVQQLKGQYVSLSEGDLITIAPTEIFWGILSNYSCIEVQYWYPNPSLLTVNHKFENVINKWNDNIFHFEFLRNKNKCYEKYGINSCNDIVVKLWSIFTNITKFGHLKQSILIPHNKNVRPSRKIVSRKINELYDIINVSKNTVIKTLLEREIKNPRNGEYQIKIYYQQNYYTEHFLLYSKGLDTYITFEYLIQCAQEFKNYTNAELMDAVKLKKIQFPLLD